MSIEKERVRRDTESAPATFPPATFILKHGEYGNDNGTDKSLYGKIVHRKNYYYTLIKESIHIIIKMNKINISTITSFAVNGEGTEGKVVVPTSEYLRTTFKMCPNMQSSKRICAFISNKVVGFDHVNE